MSMTFKKPKKTCDDRNCPFHGTLAVTRTCTGRHRSHMQRWIRPLSLTENSYNSHQNSYVTKDDTVTSHHTTHHASTLRKATDVKIAECRPVSKTVSFVVVEKLGEEK